MPETAVWSAQLVQLQAALLRILHGHTLWDACPSVGPGAIGAGCDQAFTKEAITARSCAHITI